MQSQSIHVHEFANGLTLLVEEMPQVQSAALTVMVPAGAIYESDNSNGAAAALCDWMTRGAAGLDSRGFSNALDHLGVQRSESVGWNFLSFSAALLPHHLPAALRLYAEMVRRPELPDEHFEAVLSGVEQSLLAEEDEPQRKVLDELRRTTYDSPWNRPTEGTLSELEHVTPEAARALYERGVRPNGCLIGVAGRVDAGEVRRSVEELFGDWTPRAEPVVTRRASAQHYRHLPQDSSQTQIGLAYPAVAYGAPDYYAAWAAVGILSGGSSSRLFTEVREKRGLCYSGYAMLNSLLTEGRVLSYAGTTVERAQETLDVMVAEIRRLDQDLTTEELRRCQARAKSSLIMQQESTGARAASIARDWFHLRRVNTLADVHAAVEAVTIEQVADYVRRRPARDLTLLTIGPEPLRPPAGS